MDNGQAGRERSVAAGTLPGPFEWDVKRLVASLVVAGRDNGFAAADARRVAVATAARYRKAMREFAASPTLAVW